MLLKPCDHCGQDLALYWVPDVLRAGRSAFISYAVPDTDYYRDGRGLLVWARSVDDVQNACIRELRPVTHAVTVCPASEFRAVADAAKTARGQAASQARREGTG